MKNDIRFFGIAGVVLLVAGVYVLNSNAITEYDSFVGLSSLFLGILFIIYTLFLWGKSRQRSPTSIHEAVAHSRTSEQQLMAQSSHSPTYTSPSTSNTLMYAEQVSSRAQLVTALEELIHQYQSGDIDASTYYVRKNELVQYPDAPKRHMTNHVILSDNELIDDILIDYMEGLITSTEYEYRKSQIITKAKNKEMDTQ